MPDDKHLNALRVYWKEHKAFPSMARLADVLGLASSGGVFKVIARLVDAGYLERVDGQTAWDCGRQVSRVRTPIPGPPSRWR